jgi:hypothetical protein
MTPQFKEKISFTARDRSDVNYYLPSISKDWLIGFIEALYLKLFKKKLYDLPLLKTT